MEEHSNLLVSTSTDLSHCDHHLAIKEINEAHELTRQLRALLLPSLTAGSLAELAREILDNISKSCSLTVFLLQSGGHDHQASKQLNGQGGRRPMLDGRKRRYVHPPEFTVVYNMQHRCRSSDSHIPFVMESAEASLVKKNQSRADTPSNGDPQMTHLLLSDEISNVPLTPEQWDLDNDLDSVMSFFEFADADPFYKLWM
ncbi:hypothetical protein B296_00056516 [Ensete ventricosum]|uniref:Uncharacterized protein n=1 Tax=Ensete ventricosum TaxID=4639 RepID=A0A426X4H3_ENSVE|nr:hypothetical protein B296_00056516 [Ensete ventricosum]